MTWDNAQILLPMRFSCGHRRSKVLASQGYCAGTGGNGERFLYICPSCDCPAFFDEYSRQHPDAIPGSEVLHLPGVLEQLYLEARSCCAAFAFTASVLMCRKMLMNIAVDLGADKELKFNCAKPGRPLLRTQLADSGAGTNRSPALPGGIHQMREDWLAGLEGEGTCTSPSGFAIN
jgi:hypothetical protein